MFSDLKLYIFLFGTTLTSVAILLNSIREKKKKKQDEKQV
jgi:hypothetical protein